MPHIISINGTDVALGETTRIDLQIAKLPTHTVIDLPVYIYRAPTDGPVLLITAGLHGDELNGVEIIRTLTASKEIIPTMGTVLVIPVVNVYGFINNSRTMPDGRDLNRSFPGSKNGSLAARIAHTLMNTVIPHIDYGVDLHTGGANQNYPQIRCTFDIEKNLELAKAFSPPFIVNSSLRDGSFRRETQKLGKTILVFEGGESLRFDEITIKEGIEGVKRLMSYLGMNNSAFISNRETVIIKKSSWIRANHSGLYRPFIDYGEEVKRNQIIATITDPYGETEYKLKSRFDGHVLAIRSSPIVNRGDAIVHIGTTNLDQEDD
ncbi:MAG: succinylglutamate desuccinylase [Candidatus Dadabacteria bacterium]|nr:succinylglutamate desuccinylase [Candidatus Dadabacteria bacterium]NIT13335.1 succinylglutamate desuccinylase [Candidatus Dadabacteria bacterium]